MSDARKGPWVYDYFGPGGRPRDWRFDDDVLVDQRAPPAADAPDSGPGSPHCRLAVFRQRRRPERRDRFPDYLEWKKNVTTLEGIAAIQEATFIVSGGDKPERYLGGQISADAFSFLGVQPILGRQFRPEEDQLNAAPVALIGYDIWQNHFGGDRAVVGKTIPINGKQVTIVGVMPKGWRFPEVCDIWMPLQMDEKDSSARQISSSIASAR